MTDEKIVGDDHLEQLAVVANCKMNRERRLRGSGGYEAELRFDLVDYLVHVASDRGWVAWLDLCCGAGLALVDAAFELEERGLVGSFHGLDLVDRFPDSPPNVTFVPGTVSDWYPSQQFDLITCVHGLHYVGDKLGIVERAVAALAPSSRFLANIDAASVVVDGATSRVVTAAWRGAGLEYDSRHKLLTASSAESVAFPFRYLGADPDAGANYTGQDAVDSYYARIR